MSRQCRRCLQGYGMVHCCSSMVHFGFRFSSTLLCLMRDYGGREEHLVLTESMEG